MRHRRRAPHRYGRPPVRVVLVHGGPGAPGTLAPVARALAPAFGVLEPWQSKRSVDALVQELSHQIDRWTSPPVTLVGHSWGAWLSLLMAGEHPEKVRRVILVGSAPFRARYAAEIRRRRRERLGPEAGKEFDELERRLRARTGRPSSRVLRRLGALAGVADSYELIPHTASRVETDSKAFRAVWAEAEALRRSGALVRSLRRVRSPVLVIHGTRDSHPLSGVVEPLRTVGVKLRVVALPRCGHEPWRERHARERFFAVLRDELAKAERHEPA